MNHEQLHRRARERGVNPFVYWPVRWFLIPFFSIYFRMNRIGREHVPDTGPVIIAPGHADDCVTVAMGYGRRGEGEGLCRGLGFDTATLRHEQGHWFGPGSR